MIMMWLHLHWIAGHTAGVVQEPDDNGDMSRKDGRHGVLVTTLSLDQVGSSTLSAYLSSQPSFLLFFFSWIGYQLLGFFLHDY